MSVKLKEKEKASAYGANNVSRSHQNLPKYWGRDARREVREGDESVHLRGGVDIWGDVRARCVPEHC